MVLKKRKIILFLPDFQKSPDERQQDFETLKLSLGHEYGVITSHFDIRQPVATTRKLRRLANDAIDFIIGDGLGSFFSHNFFPGHNRLSINPMLWYREVEKAITKSTYKIYKESIPECSDSDYTAGTQKWAIISPSTLLRDDYTPLLFGSNVTVLEGAISITPTLIQDAVLPIINQMENSSWTSPEGVHFIHNGKVIDKVIPSIFNRMKTYKMPDEVEYIYAEVFRKCNLRKITLSKDLEAIPVDCFKNSKYLENVEMDCPRLEVLGRSCFEGCISLKNISLVKTSLLSLQDNCFHHTGLNQLELPDSVKYMDPSAIPDSCKLIINKTRYSQLLDDYRCRLAAEDS